MIQQMLLCIIKLVNFCSSFEVFSVDFAFFLAHRKTLR